MGIDSLFWKNKRVLITGHTGFKGSWLTLWLKELGADVIGYSLKPFANPSLYEEARISENITSLYGNILEYEKLQNVILEYQPEIIFHMAAQSLVKKSYDDPKETFETNIIGTINLFEAVRKTNFTKVIINVTSDKCYENREIPYWGYRENDPMGGFDPYSASKGCAELVTNSYRKSFFNNENTTRLASVRAGNVIGGGDWSENRLIPDIVRAIQQGRMLDIRNPQAVRPWQHVLEPLSGYIMLAQEIYTNDGYDEGWNFGPKEGGIISVKEILSMFVSQSQFKNDIEISYEKQSSFHEAHFLRLDCSKAFYKLNWQPKLTIQETVRWTSDWYEYYLNETDMRMYTLKQIKDYMELKEGD